MLDVRFNDQMRLLYRRAPASSRSPLFRAKSGIPLSHRMERRLHLSRMAKIRSSVIYMCSWWAKKDHSG